MKFFNVFYKIGGQFVDAADIIEHSIQDTVRDKLTVQLIMYYIFYNYILTHYFTYLCCCIYYDYCYVMCRSVEILNQLPGTYFHCSCPAFAPKSIPCTQFQY